MLGKDKKVGKLHTVLKTDEISKCFNMERHMSQSDPKHYFIELLNRQSFHLSLEYY